MKLKGKVVKFQRTVITLSIKGERFNMLLFGRSEQELIVGNYYEFSHIEDGGRKYKSFKFTEKTTVKPVDDTDDSSSSNEINEVEDEKTYINNNHHQMLPRNTCHNCSFIRASFYFYRISLNNIK